MARRSKRGGKRTRQVRAYRAETVASAYVPTHAAIKLRGVGMVCADPRHTIGDDVSMVEPARVRSFADVARLPLDMSHADTGVDTARERSASGVEHVKADASPPATRDDLTMACLRVLIVDYGFAATLAVIENANRT